MSSKTVGRPMEILLVEDNLIDARLAIDALKKGGVKHRLTLVCDGMEATHFLFQQAPFTKAPRPDLILLDLRLPKKDGRVLLADIKTDESLKQIPVVVLTASRGHEDRLRSEQLQVESYMTKPLDMEKFGAVINDLKKYWRNEAIVLPV